MPLPVRLWQRLYGINIGNLIIVLTCREWPRTEVAMLDKCSTISARPHIALTTHTVLWGGPERQESRDIMLRNVNELAVAIIYVNYCALFKLRCVDT